MSGYLYIGMAALLLLVAVLTLVAMLRALTVSTTLAAIESAFGSFVLSILLLLGASKLKQAGLEKMRHSQVATENR